MVPRQRTECLMAIKAKKGEHFVVGNRRSRDPHVTHLFDIIIGGITKGRFQEFSGLSGSNEIFEIKEGGLNSRVHKFVTRSSAGDITLKRGFVNDRSLFDWFTRTAYHSLTQRRDGIVAMMDDNNRPVCYWFFSGAFPTKWEGPTLNAGQSAIAVESITLVCEEVRLELP
jgi:phage tail-like protein